MTNLNKLPIKLKEFRKKNQFSQEYVADYLNISRQAISNWENGKTTPDIENLLLLSQLYNISLDELVGDKASTNSVDTVNITKTHILILEIIGLSVILILFAQFPFISFVAPILIAIWLKNTNRKYVIIYILCAACFLIGLYNTYIFLIYLLPTSGNYSITPM